MLKKELYKKNRDVLAGKNPELASRLDALDLSGAMADTYQVLTTKNGLFTLQIRIKDQVYLLHSKYDPQQESDSLADKLIRDKYDIIFCGGFGLGYLILSLFQKKGDHFSKVIVIEKDLILLKIALSLSDLTPLLGDERFLLLHEEKNDIKGLNDILIQSVTKKCYTFIPSLHFKLDHDFYSNLKYLIESYLSRKNINIATLTRFQNLWIYNIFRNHGKFLSSKGIDGFSGSFRDKPCLVISAGPSLNDSIAMIRDHQEKFIIIAVDSIFQTLVRQGIDPDFVVTVDPQYINFKYFEYNRYFKASLVSEISAFPLTLKKYRGPIYFFSSVFPLARFMERFTSAKGEIDMGGSVSTTAFDLAVRTGADPIILAGQDLAFLKDRTHAKGSYVEKYWSLRYNKFNTSFNGVYRYIYNNLFIRIRSNNGSLVQTDKRLMIFLVWFQNKMNTEEMQKRTVYNTSLDGARMDKMIVKTLDEIMQMNDFPDIRELKRSIRERSSEETSADQEGFLREMKELKGHLNKLQPIVEESIVSSRRLYELVRKNARQDIQGLLNKLDHNDKKIRELSQVTDVLSLLVQDRIYSILEEYENFLTEEEKKNDDLKTAKRNLILYTGIGESITLFRKLFQLIKE
ncbi:MAG: DUF115 domain-containing protein [bacterium]|nr:DUF115 domain-containing protein [bacterium]